MFFFNLYHQQSKNRLHEPQDSIPRNEWPVSWETTYIKSYPRFASLRLPEPQQLHKTVSDCLLSRESRREFTAGVNLEQLSSLLYYSIGEKDKSRGVATPKKRMYQSAGARYPLEFYIINFKSKSFESGVYHYDVTNHALVTLKKISFTENDLKKISREKFVQTAQFAVVFSSTFSRTSDKYGERSYRFILLETGAVMQNFSLCADALGIDAVSIGGSIDDATEELIDIDGTKESIVHTMYFG